MTLMIIIFRYEIDTKLKCTLFMYYYLIVYLALLFVIILIELTSVVISCRGTITNAKPRKLIRHLIYIRLVLVLVEIIFIIIGCIYLLQFTNECSNKSSGKLLKRLITGKLTF
jgi:sn1-specific diacylglycerol lipase